MRIESTYLIKELFVYFNEENKRKVKDFLFVLFKSFSALENDHLNVMDRLNLLI